MYISPASVCPGVADTVTATTTTATTTRHGNKKQRPWKCCNKPLCAREANGTIVFCNCLDTGDSCSDACENCEAEEEAMYECMDEYWGDPGPRCDDHRNTNIIHLPNHIEFVRKRMAVVRGERKHGQERPWKCCDDAVPGPTTEGTTVWYCKDKLDKCPCKDCVKLKDGSHSYYCLDGYQGSDPGPTCSSHA